MKIQELIYKCRVNELVGNPKTEINEIQFDSRKVTAGDLFVAVIGSQSDGHLFIDKAIEQGATAIVCQNKPKTLHENITYVMVENAALELGQIAANQYGNPTEKLKLIGVTGTNGKTTSTTLLYNLFMELGYPTALVSTINIRINETEVPNTHTTPDIVTLNKILAQAVDAGCEYCFMEVSSHGIHQYRIAGLRFKVAAFSNLSHDHLDYHKTFAEYRDTKKKFFDDLDSKAFALTNVDDKNGGVMLQNTKAKKLTYGIKNLADYKGKIIENRLDGMLLEFNQKSFHSTLVGAFNGYNLLLAYAVADVLGIDSLHTLTALSRLNNVRGRFELFTSEKGINFIVDYAHTPDALDNVLQTINATRTRNETLFTVVGCGGDRDRDKRPEMAKIACEQSDRVLLTSDNPRTENPNTILNEMEAGVPAQHGAKYTKIPDRKEAIKLAIQSAKENDIILIAGKGHETYQEINGVRNPFDDRAIAESLSKLLEK